MSFSLSSSRRSLLTLLIYSALAGSSSANADLSRGCPDLSGTYYFNPEACEATPDPKYTSIRDGGRGEFRLELLKGSHYWVQEDLPVTIQQKGCSSLRTVSTYDDGPAYSRGFG